MAMADNRPGRYSPPSKSNHFPKLPSFASPTAPSNPSRKLDHFSPVSDALSPLPGLSPTLDRRNHERGSDLAFTSSKVIVRLRRLPRNFGNDALRSMLLFAKDLDETKFVESEFSLEDTGFSCAVATFHSIDGAREVQSRLNGKPNATNDANMIIEVLPNVYTGPRRGTGDGSAARQQSGSASSTSSSNNPLSRQSSRFSTSFQSKDFQTKEKVSPPMGSPTAISKEFPAPDGTNSLKNLFSPRSPVANHYYDHRRISGKDVIGNDGADEETTQLLSDPVAFYQNGHIPPRGFGNPLPNFGGLSLNTSNVDGNSNRLSSPNDSGFASPRSIRSPPSAQSPAGMPNIGANGNFGMNFGQSNYPAINPADQHPPCNTLYVGNLPMDANEDELKQIFTKQRGFKRLCYRMKHNGPMCFVEFEDTSYAIKALGELYGVPLHNSYRGGMRLSFSKNPLGVRSGQNGQQSSISPAASHPFSNGAGAPPGFAAANGPPPGLLPPGGVRSPTTYAPPPPPALDGFGRGFAPRYAGSGSHARTQPFAGGYSNGPLNGGYSTSMNGIFMDHPSGR